MSDWLWIGLAVLVVLVIGYLILFVRDVQAGLYDDE